MPKLNAIILEDIAAQFCCEKENVTYGWYAKVNKNAEHLLKFMLCGRECLNATLDYFERSKKVTIQHHTITVHVKPFVGKKENAHVIPYRFELMKLLMDIIAPSVENLIIAECPKDRRGYTVIDQLIHEGLKRLQLDDLIDMDYMQRIKNECFLEEFQSICFNANSPEISEIFAVKSSRYTLTTDFIDLHDHMHVNSFPGVKNLCINVKIDKKDIDEFNFANELENLSAVITDSFPNLQTLKLLFNNDSGVSLHHMVGAFRRDCFDNISARVKGIIYADFQDTKAFFNDAIEMYGEQPNFVCDKENQKIIKEEEIHAGFTLKLEIQCHGILRFFNVVVPPVGEPFNPFPQFYA